MANRRGTFLSDENMKKLCNEGRPVPMEKVYNVIKTANRPYRLSSRPKNSGIMIRELAFRSSLPVEVIRQRYMAGIEQTTPERVEVYGQKRTHEEAFPQRSQQAQRSSSQRSRPGLVREVEGSFVRNDGNTFTPEKPVPEKKEGPQIKTGLKRPSINIDPIRKDPEARQRKKPDRYIESM